MKFKNIFLLLAFIAFAGCASFTPLETNKILHKSKPKFGYQFAYSIPKSSESKPPLLIFLHGSGERGEDLNRVSIHGPLRLIKEGRDLPFLIIAPQLEEDGNWNVQKLDETLAQIEKQFDFDRNRVYLTGLSRGGLGVWNWAMHSPNKFAAIAPIAGWSNVGDVCQLTQTPVWAFHGEKDDVVRIFHTEDMVKWLKECGGKPIFTRYENANHDSWTKTYYNQEFYDWLLAQSKPQK